jgi:peptidoglycan/xylan/chitin deacetylase (PgdA/CDA1 family)
VIRGQQRAISVVVPAYNGEETLGTTLDSLIAQTHPDWEAIVVDDGSVDGTAALARAYADRDRRIRLRRQENRGVGGARNAGIEMARHPWMFFLDADDTIVPEAFEELLGGLSANPGADAVLAGCLRVDGSGRKLRSQIPGSHHDRFSVFARMCEIAIHSCLVRTELVRQAGGFDESLATCEDWDIWQRISRLGAQFVTIPHDLAIYRMRADSASHDGRRMLRDGLLVIDRGHGIDERMLGLEQDDLELPSLEGRSVARTYFACYAAGLEIAMERDARWVIEALGDDVSSRIDPAGVAETLLLAVADGRVAPPSDWVAFPPEVHELCRAFVTELGERLGDHWLAFSTQNELERMVLRQSPAARPARVGRWALIELDAAGPPPLDLELDGAVELALCRVCFGEMEIGEVEVPLADGLLEHRVLADAIVARFAWELLGVFLERHVYPQLQISSGSGRGRAERDGVLLFDGPLEPGRPANLALHDKIGWIVFLQELWDDPTATTEAFYGDRPGDEEGAVELRGDERLTIDVAEDLRALRRVDGASIDLAVRVGGVPLTSVSCSTDNGFISAHRLRREIVTSCGYELCRAVLREAVLLSPEGAGGSLRQRLESALSANRAAGGPPLIAPGTTVVGRTQGPDGTSASRWLALPRAAQSERLALAQLDGDPVSGPTGGPAGPLLSAPLTLDRPARPAGALTDSSLLRSLEFDQIFAQDPDPWEAGSAYERDKYDLTLKMVPRGIGRAVELGCAEGTFTVRLADRVDQLTAVDLSFPALSRARKRCADKPNVTFARLDAFEDPIGGTYDLVVCSELLYYTADLASLRRAIGTLAAALEPGGLLLAAHAHTVVDEPTEPGFDWDVPFGAATIDAVLRESERFELRNEARTAAYRVQLWKRCRRPSRLPRLPRRGGRVAAAEPEGIPEFLPEGGQVRPQPQAPPTGTKRLPILMYHRVAPAGSAATARWRLHPEAFEEQLAWLRDQGYNSIDFEQWRVSADRRHPIPARSVMITFDDGYADFPEHAQRLLAKYDFQATVFVVTDLVGQANRWDATLGETLELMDWATLGRLAAAGLEIGSHSSAHRPLASLQLVDLARDLCRSRVRLHEELGTAVRSVCYPYGLHDPAVRAVAGACGFQYGVTTNEWSAAFGDDLLMLPRIEIKGADGLDEFRRKLVG